ncbi:serine/threonine-protein kinase [Actinomycetospora straminea]|uniref:non-specific serine/threonine protein kinase n=1 Tax=Actinomycetospora straminea TaxID=663607 RepID=A0ABP9E3I6_9PSEU|nr:serine/threonine-protein kinase [Actinomycetospora straminea]MDD7931438.1 serine/threonine-protein kinase [Actinomycetospora straminea]
MTGSPPGPSGGPAAGSTFGPYRLEGRLGRGGMGEVHRAYDTRRDREVALKCLTPDLADDPEIRERFERECRTAARLSSPHVIPIHDFGVIDGRLFLDMRLVEGRDLARLIADEGPLDPARAVAIVGQVADALDDAHAHDLVHRDVKPGNVLVSPGRDFVHLVDFGIVRLAQSSTGGRALTGTGTTLGTLAYMAPEQFEGAAVDRRADVYALAVVLHECLVGAPPFDGDMPAMLHQHLTVTPAPPSSRRPGLPPALDAVVLRGLAKRPEERFASAGELADAARAALEGRAVPAPVPAPAPSPGGPGVAPGAEHGRATYVGPGTGAPPPGGIRWDSGPRSAGAPVSGPGAAPAQAWSPAAPGGPTGWGGPSPWSLPPTTTPGGPGGQGGQGGAGRRGRTIAIVVGALVLVAAVVVTLLVVVDRGSSGPVAIATGAPATLAQSFPDSAAGGCVPGDPSFYEQRPSAVRPVEVVQCTRGDATAAYARWSTPAEAANRVLSYTSVPSIDGLRTWQRGGVVQGPYWQTTYSGDCTLLAAYEGLATMLQIYAPQDRCAGVAATFASTPWPSADELRAVERTIPAAARAGCGAATPTAGTSGIVPREVRSCTGAEGTTVTWSRWNGAGDVAAEVNARGSRTGETVSSWNAPDGPRQGPYIVAEDGGTCRGLLGWDAAPYAAEVVGPDCAVVERAVTGLLPPAGTALPG